MAHVVVLGGSTAGLMAAYEIADLLQLDERVTVISDRREFQAGQPPPWITAGTARQPALYFPLEAALVRKRIDLAPHGARRLHPDEGCVELDDGTLLSYDFLVIATGPRPAFDEIEGLGPRGYTQSICHADHLPDCAAAWEALIDDPGPVVVGAAQGAPCIAPAYEAALQIARELRRLALHTRSPITFLTPEPYIGASRLAGPDTSPDLLVSALREAGMRWITSARVDKVEPGVMWISGPELPVARALPFRFSVVMPPLRPVDAVSDIAGLADEHGAILVDEWLRNPRYRNIYASGVAVASASPEQRPAEAGVRRRPYVAGPMTSVVAQNIRDQIDGRPPAHASSWSRIGLVNLGAPGLAFIEQREAQQRRGDWFASPSWIHVSRCATCDVGR
jgi:sulfide:quinone oxidoreductase